jgi:hypothetical protein
MLIKAYIDNAAPHSDDHADVRNSGLIRHGLTPWLCYNACFE